MSEERISMSQPERDVLKVMGLVMPGERTQPEAARLLDEGLWKQKRRRNKHRTRRPRRECFGEMIQADGRLPGALPPNPPEVYRSGSTRLMGRGKKAAEPRVPRPGHQP